MILRDAVPEDRALLERFTIALQDFEREREPNRRPGAEMAAEHIDALDAWADASPVSAHLIAEIDAVPAGWLFFAVYEEEEKITPEETRASGSISALWVEPEFRRQGIASALIAEAEARMRDAGLKRVEIGAIVSNRRAIDLYRRLGFSDYQLSLGKQL